MLIHPNFNPVAISFGKISVYWYGIMYLAAFMIARVIGKFRLNIPYVINQKWSINDIDDILFYGLFGIIFGGRLGYVLFYNLNWYFYHPIDIIKIWNGGMSFHGGLIGVIFSMLIFAYNKNRSLFQVTDFIVPMVPLGIAFGRLGNFINGELWGRVTDSSTLFSMMFPRAINDDIKWIILNMNNSINTNLINLFNEYHMLPRHPSQLYEGLLEGIILFFFMFFLSKKSKPTGVISSLFLIIYGIMRFFIEFIREPDESIGLIALNFSLGQWLTIPMIILGFIILFRIYIYKYKLISF